VYKYLHYEGTPGEGSLAGANKALKGEGEQTGSRHAWPGGVDDNGGGGITQKGCLDFIHKIKLGFAATGQFKRFTQMLLLYQQQVILHVILQVT